MSDSLHVVFDRLGKHVTPLVVYNLCKISRLTEQQLFSRCGLVEESIRKMFASAADFLIERIKDELIPFSITKNPHLSLEAIAKEIREVETMGFIRNLTSHEHIGFIYYGKAIKDAVLSQFFDPSVPPEPLKALIPLGINGNPIEEIDDTQRIMYDESLKAEGNSKAMDMFALIGEMHKSNRSERDENRRRRVMVFEKWL